ncbi:hypothetical protein HC752_12610 [Vibrio sp. S9_S30]|uniref:hypothetical protein n=1 Tax=Vibrio sp. S9_S30 TaxID=2720226 RepID=UPI00168180AB|nr:hypothetical protein [Vibrio sp. S9_S30]MBD1557775.1 hypothetical protein [Vibrio sp. S9_S30]
MANQLKTIWITMLSIVALLFSGFVSSAPVMMGTMGEQAPSKASPCHASSVETTSNHSMETTHSDHLNTSEKSASCLSDSYGGHACCVAVCSATFAPLPIRDALTSTRFTLSPFFVIMIGDKISRTQTLLRPPIA